MGQPASATKRSAEMDLELEVTHDSVDPALIHKSPITDSTMGLVRSPFLTGLEMNTFPDDISSNLFDDYWFLNPVPPGTLTDPSDVSRALIGKDYPKMADRCVCFITNKTCF